MILAHRCQCGHVDFQHGRNGLCQMQPCRCAGCTPNAEPDLLRSWSTDTRPAAPSTATVEVLEVVEPGSRFGGSIGWNLCSCSTCRAKAAAYNAQNG